VGDNPTHADLLRSPAIHSLKLDLPKISRNRLNFAVVLESTSLISAALSTHKHMNHLRPGIAPAYPATIATRCRKAPAEIRSKISGANSTKFD